jgi:hypothetical protein
MRTAARITGIALGLASALHAAGALACGHCVEDKIAAVYDHAVVTRALAAKHQVVFFAIDGALASDEPSRLALERAAGSSRGVDQGSVRLSAEAAALSVAFDPQRMPLAALQRGLERKFASKRVSLLLLRVMDKPAQFQAASAKP